MTFHKPTKFWLVPINLIGLFCSLLCAFQGSGQTDSSARSHDAERLNHRGVEHLNKKEYDEAIKLFREALQVQSDYVPALDNLGKALDGTGKDDEAIADFDKALKIAPENAALHSDKALALYHEKKYEESAAANREALKIHPDFAEAQNGLGAALQGLGKNDEAVQAFRKAVELNPKNVDALNNLGTGAFSARSSGPGVALPPQSSQTAD